MGLMDRLRESAQDIAAETKTKLEEVGLRRRMDDAAKQLGYLIFRERAKGAPAGSDADTLVNQMRALDEQMAAQPQGGEGGGAPPSSSEPVERTQEGATPPPSPPAEGHRTDRPS